MQPHFLGYFQSLSFLSHRDSELYATLLHLKFKKRRHQSIVRQPKLFSRWRATKIPQQQKSLNCSLYFFFNPGCMSNTHAGSVCFQLECHQSVLFLTLPERETVHRLNTHFSGNHSNNLMNAQSEVMKHSMDIDCLKQKRRVQYILSFLLRWSDFSGYPSMSGRRPTPKYSPGVLTSCTSSTAR